MEWTQRLEWLLQETRRPSLKELRAIIESLELTIEKVASYIAEPGALPYGRSVIYRSGDAEAVLIHLPAGQETYIHDHGFSIGCAMVVEGAFANRIYRLDSYGYPIYCGETQVESGGFYTVPKKMIHQLCNTSESRAISLHIYTPQLSGVKTYFPYEQVLDYVI
ncbi:cysteine dioxygenase [Paenibacillus cremeus]|uniref:Cysteine dioxygenase n=1 Tax=Paenibacillus cremeus TaxID=2163881 RepID=A0A559KA66_9BACL|nr:cysteine dioxygenase family protein [Paenibacillus cremeus]TVY09014.1 hypothetical protein FPZ49_16160 [Paenibacillus cremeus]